MQALLAMRSVATGHETRGKIESDKRKQLQARAAEDVAGARGGVSGPPAPSSFNVANSEYVREHAQAQTLMRREQDASLDTMSSALDRIGEMATTIDNELREQDAILVDVDRDMDTAQGKMDSAIKGVEKLLKTKDKCQLATIVCLVVVFLIVAIVAFYQLTG